MSGNPKTYGELHDKAVELLNSRFEAGQLFTHVTQKKTYHLSFLAEKLAPAQQVDLLLKLCGRRREGEPLQYLLGEWEFYGLPFKVGKGVLIPRADTETLVDVALKKINGIQLPEILDLCSGTGCVAVAIAHNRRDAEITAIEVSESAFSYLAQNIKLNRVNVTPIRQDLNEYTHPVKLNLVVTNPPYVPREVIPGLQAEVKREPKLALDGGGDGLDFYRAIAQRFGDQILPGGWICLEVGIGQSERVAKIFEANGYGEIEVQNDYAGVPRVVSARKGAL